MSLEEARKRLDAEIVIVKLLKAIKGEAGYDLAAIVAEAEAVLEAVNDPPIPIPMVLHCPRCGLQHIDAPSEGWDNPPHRSHLCHGCGCIWRPADVPTTGVEAIATVGSADTWPASREPDDDGTLSRRRAWITDEQAALEAYVADHASSIRLGKRLGGKIFMPSRMPGDPA